MIVTFYSYKGGVGRSMAMANVARWFQLLGLNVVIVDWDLEAPGLESFFSSDKDTLAGWRGRVGLADLIAQYRQDFHLLGLAEPEAGKEPEALQGDVARLHKMLAPLRFSLLDIPAPVGEFNSSASAPGKLRLLAAGWREGAERFAAYANTVQSIDWSDFYESLRGQAYFEWLRESLCDPEVADIVLIDSRTGVTEMGGVCTRHLADVVTVLSAPNRQNIQGATMVARSFLGLVDKPWRENRPIQLVVVPSRIDLGSRSVKSAFEPLFREHTAGLMPEGLQRLNRDFWDLRIPYVDDYAFEEKMVIGEPGADPDLESAYRSLAAHIGWLAPQTSRIRLAMRAEFDRIFGAELVRAELDVAAQFEGAWQRVPEAMRGRMRELLLRMVQVVDSADEPPRARHWRRADAEAHYAGEVAVACEAGLLSAGLAVDGAERLSLADPAFVANGQLAAWIDEERPLLSWRQRLRTYLDDWLRNGQENGALLQGALLDEAERHSAAGVPLLADELNFIAHSREAADAAIAAAAAAIAPPPVMSSGSGLQAESRLDAPRRSALRRHLGVAMATSVAGLLALGWFMQMRGSNSASPDAVAVDALVMDGKRLIDAGGPGAAVEKFDAALRLDPRSIEALLARADAKVKAGAIAEARADLDRAVELAPALAAPRQQRARLRAESNDTAGALADLAALENVSDTLDLATRSMRARLLAEDGQIEASLQAWERVLELGNVAEGQIGRAQALERLGRADEAVAAYRTALQTTSDERLRTLAQARLQVLAPGTGPAPAVAAVAYLQLSAAADEPLVPGIGQALEKAGVAAVKQRGSYVWELVKSGSSRGEVRYFFPEDRQVAEKARTAVQQALATQGIDRVLAVQAVDVKKLGLADAQRGRVEVWMPSIATVRGLRFGIFVCTASGESAAAIAQKAETIASTLGASTIRKSIDEAARTGQFGLPPTGYEIRFSETIITELLAARLLAGDAEFSRLATWRAVAAMPPTPGYMSLFVCPEAGKPPTGAPRR